MCRDQRYRLIEIPSFGFFAYADAGIGAYTLVPRKNCGMLRLSRQEFNANTPTGMPFLGLVFFHFHIRENLCSSI